MKFAGWSKCQIKGSPVFRRLLGFVFFFFVCVCGWKTVVFDVAGLLGFWRLFYLSSFGFFYQDTVICFRIFTMIWVLLLVFIVNTVLLIVFTVNTVICFRIFTMIWVILVVFTINTFISFCIFTWVLQVFYISMISLVYSVLPWYLDYVNGLFLPWFELFIQPLLPCLEVIFTINNVMFKYLYHDHWRCCEHIFLRL